MTQGEETRAMRNDGDDRERDHAEPAMVRPALLVGVCVVLAAATIIRTVSLVPHVYDDGVEACAGWLVTRGEVPYRDFYYFYGPATPYLLAAAFRVAGTSLPTMHVLEGILLFALALSIFAFASTLTGLRLALITVPLLAAGIIRAVNVQLPVIGALLCLVLGALALRKRSKRGDWKGAFWPGVLVGMVPLWRVDFGLYALLGFGLSAATLTAIAASARRRGASNVGTGLAGPHSSSLPAFLAGLALPTVASLTALLVVVSPGALFDCLVKLPIRTGGMMQLPVPAPAGNPLLLLAGSSGMKAFAVKLVNAAPLYLSGLVLTAALCAWVVELRATVQTRVAAPRISVAATALLAASLGLAFYATWRADHTHAWPLLMMVAAFLPATFAAVSSLRRHRPGAPRALCTAWLILTLGYYTVFLALGVADPARRFVPSLRAMHMSRPAAGSMDRSRRGPELTPDMVIEYVREHVPPDASVFSALPSHDRTLGNDVTLYFLSRRRPSTYWYTFNPGVTTTAPVQRRIARDLERSRTPIVVIWRLPLPAEGNASTSTSGIHILDAYLAANYHKTLEIGQYSALTRRVPPNPRRTKAQTAL